MALIGGGGHAERVVVPADLLIPVPTQLSWAEAGGFPEIFSTAWDALVSQAQVGVGDRILITGAAGGVGTAMVQIASATGADVVASVHRRELHEKVKSLVPEQRYLTVVTPDEAPDHGPFDVIVELVGRDDCLQQVSRLRTGGRLLLVGVHAGTTAPLPISGLLLARAKVIGTTIRGRSPTEKAVLAHKIRTKVAPLLAERRIRVPIEATYRLEEYADAYGRLAAPGKFGKIVFTP
nr:zinc-binding dehydrogenase [Nocardia transvalensis]